jgi:hypothetical protein
MRKAVFILLVPVISGLLGCDSDTRPKKRAAIVFGDSTMIVTETDPKYLNDNVTDFRPKPEPIAKDSSLAAAPVETPKAPEPKPEAPVATAAPAASNGKSLRIEIPGVAGADIDWTKKNGVSVSVDEGSVKGKNLVVQGLTEVKVQQREQTVVLLRLRRAGRVKLSLPGDYSNWETLIGKNGSYAIDQARAVYGARIKSNALRTAAQRAAKSARLSRRDTDELIRSLRNVQSANQKPLEAAIQSYVWRIDGKGADGKPVHRELRVDIRL